MSSLQQPEGVIPVDQRKETLLRRWEAAKRKWSQFSEEDLVKQTLCGEELYFAAADLIDHLMWSAER